MKKIKIKCFFIIFIIFVFIIGVSFIYFNRNMNILFFFNMNKIKKLEEINIIYLDDLNIGNITCTGLTYDSKNKSFWIADYDSNLNDSKITPRLIETDLSFKKVKSIINIKNADNTINLQGISYSKQSDSIWIATGKHIQNISKDGKTISKFDVNSKLKCDSNGLYYNDNDNTIDILCYKDYLLKYDSKGNLLSKIEMNIKNQDHIFKNGSRLYLTAGADYDGKNYIFVFNKNNIEKIYELSKSYAIEGIVIYNDKIYITNDGFYHSAKIKKNYIAIYELK